VDYGWWNHCHAMAHATKRGRRRRGRRRKRRRRRRWALVTGPSENALYRTLLYIHFFQYV
jgi:hypothetical protein